MHCELIVPGLFAEASGTRAPALELLLARGRSAVQAGEESLGVEAWLRAAFAVEGETLPAGALSLAGVGGEPGGECWVRADPVHLRLLRDRLIVVPPAAFALSLERGLTVYDAAYVALAEAADAVLITADRTLAGVAMRAKLLE